MKPTHIFIVEDDPDILDILSLQLKREGFEISHATHGERFIEKLQSMGGEEIEKINLFILDRMLPGKNGVDICKFLRMYSTTQKIPILMLTALNSPEDIILGLESGADDYVSKPYDKNILLARIRSLLRRGERLEKEKKLTPTSTLNHEGVSLNPEECRVWVDNKEIELTLSEFKLLHIFIDSPGKVFTRRNLVEKIQGGSVHVTERTIDTHIFGLRKKLSQYSNMIETVRGIGYRVKSNGRTT